MDQRVVAWVPAARQQRLIARADQLELQCPVHVVAIPAAHGGTDPVRVIGCRQLDLQGGEPFVPGDGPRVDLGNLGRLVERAVAPQGVGAHASHRGIGEQAGRALLTQPAMQGPDRQEQCRGGEPVTAQVRAGEHTVGVRAAPEDVGQSAA